MQLQVAQTGDFMSIQWTIYVNQYFEREIGWVVDTSIPEEVDSLLGDALFSRRNACPLCPAAP